MIIALPLGDLLPSGYPKERTWPSCSRDDVRGDRTDPNKVREDADAVEKLDSVVARPCCAGGRGSRPRGGAAEIPGRPDVGGAATKQLGAGPDRGHLRRCAGSYLAQPAPANDE